MPALIGYVRVSKTEDQDVAPQIEALEAAGYKRVYEEKASGGRWDRPELHRLLDRLGKGDALVVWKLDRLSRSLKDLLLILEKAETAGARSSRTNSEPKSLPCSRQAAPPPMSAGSSASIAPLSAVLLPLKA